MDINSIFVFLLNSKIVFFFRFNAFAEQAKKKTSIVFRIQMSIKKKSMYKLCNKHLRWRCVWVDWFASTWFFFLCFLSLISRVHLYYCTHMLRWWWFEAKKMVYWKGNSDIINRFRWSISVKWRDVNFISKTSIRTQYTH